MRQVNTNMNTNDIKGDEMIIIIIIINIIIININIIIIIIIILSQITYILIFVKYLFLKKLIYFWIRVSK